MLKAFLDVATRERVSGWALDLTPPRSGLTVRVLVNDEVRFQGAADRFRPDLEQVYGTGAHGFDFAFEPPLPDEQLCQILICASQNNEILVARTLPAIAQNHDGYQRIQPIFVSFSGRSGSTIMMKMLSTSPDVVVAGSYPFEVMLSAYYGHAFSVLTQPGDHIRSSNPSNICEDMFRVGANPFYHHQCANNIQSPTALYDILGRQLKNGINDTFRDTILEVYETLAGAVPNAKKRYFAEKSTLHSSIREAIKCIFGKPKEIVLIRDLRDIYCSSRAFWPAGADFLNTMNAVNDSYMRINREPDLSTLVVRYEDLVMERERTAQRIAGYLGLSEPLQMDEVSESDLFQKHATSADPKASVGRWRRELNVGEKELFAQRFGDFFRAYGYEA
jgi:hypothetical protein